ncbi:MAG: DNA replication and repair protein RecF [Bdellovibrionaceae bacterium]|nr:DNA replication and repair protein RecF [Pseudobdellovibrionaceae bacterium]
MFIENIDLTYFRNFKKTNYTFNPSINIFVGLNGKGKTNLLESLYLLSSSSSFRNTTPGCFINSNEEAPYSNIKATINNDTLTELKILFQDNKKKYFIHNKPSSFKKFKIINSIVFNPESLSSVKGSAETKRQLIDEILCSISLSNNEVYTNFKKILKQRNALFFDSKKEKISQDKAQLLKPSLDEVFIKWATELTVLRLKLLSNLHDFFQDTFSAIYHNKDVKVAFNYCISSKNVQSWKEEEIASFLKEQIKEKEAAEWAYGSSLVGPHKHEISFLMNRKDSRYYSSQGQQKTLILSLKIAQMMYYYKVNKSYPILLLDDVHSELDYTVRQYLMRFLNNIKTQIFLTTTDIQFLEGFSKKGKIFKIE